jgi:hypothetical protein
MLKRVFVRRHWSPPFSFRLPIETPLSIQAGIRSMLDDVSAMEARFEPEKHWRAVRIQFPASLDEDAVMARHYSLFPDDRDANVILRIIIYSADLDDGDNTKASKAW